MIVGRQKIGQSISDQQIFNFDESYTNSFPHKAHFSLQPYRSETQRIPLCPYH